MEIPEPKGLHEGWLKIGDPINLQDYAEQYKGDRQGTIAELTEKMQLQVQHNLTEMMFGEHQNVL